MNIHATLLSQAFGNISCVITARSCKISEEIFITYKNEKIPMGDLKITDNLKKYTLSELREIAYLVLTHSKLFNDRNSSMSKIDKKKLFAVIKFIENDLFNVDLVNDDSDDMHNQYDYHNLKTQYDELRDKYNKLNEKLRTILD